MPDKIKVLLTNQGEDVETPWADDLGPVDDPPGARRVRIRNVPFFHAKPTWGDELVVAPDADGLLTWDACGVAYENITERIAKDGGRWVIIVEYTPHEAYKRAGGLRRAGRG